MSKNKTKLSSKKEVCEAKKKNWKSGIILMENLIRTKSSVNLRILLRSRGFYSHGNWCHKV